MPEEKGTETNMVAHLCDKLAKARAGSEFVIAVFCDIRSFSDFSSAVESAHTATFLKHFYLKLLRDYFKNAAFAKLNGDGLLMIFQHDDENLQKVSTDILNNCLRALKDFPTMFRGIPVINYDTPQAIGFGIARGSASYLAHDGEKLDYSGDLLNLAARLTEYARPQGIVLDGNYQVEIIPEVLRSEFKKEQVYIRGIAEERPREALYQDKVVELPPEAFRPIKNYTWKVVSQQLPVSELAGLADRFFVRLPEQPVGKDLMKVEHAWPTLTVTGKESVIGIATFDLVHDAYGHSVFLGLKDVKARAKLYSKAENTAVVIRVHYVPKQQPLSSKPSRKKNAKRHL